MLHVPSLGPGNGAKHHGKDKANSERYTGSCRCGISQARIARHAHGRIRKVQMRFLKRQLKLDRQVASEDVLTQIGEDAISERSS